MSAARRLIELAADDCDEVWQQAVSGLQALDLLCVIATMMERGDLGSMGSGSRHAGVRREVMVDIRKLLEKQSMITAAGAMVEDSGCGRSQEQMEEAVTVAAEFNRIVGADVEFGRPTFRLWCHYRWCALLACLRGRWTPTP